MLLTVILPIFGCIAGDGIIRVKGTLAKSNEVTIQNCILELHVVGHDLQPWHIINIGESNLSKIENEFLVSTTISPYCNDYYLVLKCKNKGYEYRTDNFESCGTTYVKNPYDLATLADFFQIFVQ